MFLKMQKRPIFHEKLNTEKASDLSHLTVLENMQKNGLILKFRKQIHAFEHLRVSNTKLMNVNENFDCSEDLKN